MHVICINKRKKVPWNFIQGIHPRIVSYADKNVIKIIIFRLNKKNSDSNCSNELRPYIEGIKTQLLEAPNLLLCDWVNNTTCVVQTPDHESMTVTQGNIKAIFTIKQNLGKEYVSSMVWLFLFQIIKAYHYLGLQIVSSTTKVF